MGCTRFAEAPTTFYALAISRGDRGGMRKQLGYVRGSPRRVANYTFPYINGSLHSAFALKRESKRGRERIRRMEIQATLMYTRGNVCVWENCTRSEKERGGGKGGGRLYLSDR